MIAPCAAHSAPSHLAACRPACVKNAGYNTRMTHLRVLLFVFLTECAQELPDHVVLQPSAENVVVAMEPPSQNTYQLVGQIIGEAAANDLDVAEQAARCDLRNRAAAIGASLVTIDEDLGEPMPLRDKTKVKLVGRAYKSID
jgi:hypothetical protein